MIIYDFEYDDISAAPTPNMPTSGPMCLELSPIPGPNRATSFCTEHPDHKGIHIAGLTFNPRQPVRLAWTVDA